MSFEIGYLWIGLISIFGHFCEGLAGFGCTVIAAPVVNTILPPIVGIPFGTLMAVPFLLGQNIYNIRHKLVPWKEVGRLLIVMLPCVCVGHVVFSKLNADYLRLFIGTTVTIIALMKCYENFVKPMMKQNVDPNAVPKDTPARVALRYICLVLGGIAQGALNMGGPLTTVYTMEAIKDKKLFRNTMMGVFGVIDTFNAFSHYRQGLWTAELGGVLLVALPLATIGFLIGAKSIDKMNRATFMKFVSVLLLLVGGTQLINAVKVFL